MDDTFLRTMRFDFYGELLTEKQRDCYDLHYNHDLSLQEIAENLGASRQAVWDLIRRADRTLLEMEQKTGLVARALSRRQTLREIASIAEKLPDCAEKQALLQKLRELGD